MDTGKKHSLPGRIGLVKHPHLPFLILLLLAAGTASCRFFYEGMPRPTITPSLPSTAFPFPTASPLPTFQPSGEPESTPIPQPTLAPESPTGIPTAVYPPVFEPANCAFPVPSGTNPDCGYLVVPENRLSLGSRTIRLHVAIFRSTSAEPAPDPVVHLAGGPGSSSLEVARYLFSRGLGTILESRDFILFDQRGTGYSQPRLDCPERVDLTASLLDGSLSPDEASQEIVRAFSQCHDNLVSQGIDLTAYNSAASTADFNDLRLALGYPQLNLYAVSYGTRLALTLMRDQPQAVRSAVLDSVYPLEANLYTALAPNAARAFQALFDRCAADRACSAAYPDLKTTFYSLVDSLNASPRSISFEAGGARRMVQLTGDLLMDVLFLGLYNPSVAASMPAMIAGISRDEYRLLIPRLALYFDDTSALGMNMSVQCTEEIPFSQPEEAFTQAQETSPQIAAFFPRSVQPLFAACPLWNPFPPDPRENQPVDSDIPALVLAGELDPITPPEWGRSVAARLSRSSFFEFPANGHWVTRSSPCALILALTFWEDPTESLDVLAATCGANPDRLDFVIHP